MLGFGPGSIRLIAFIYFLRRMDSLGGPEWLGIVEGSQELIVVLPIIGKDVIGGCIFLHIRERGLLRLSFGWLGEH